MGKRARDLTGRRFGRLRVLSRSCLRANDALWNVVCDCGKTRTLPACSLVSNNTRSCGCLSREVTSELMSTHGMKGTPVHNSWANMLSRCYNTKHPRYEDYGGRGITVCDRWRDSFENFYLDMGDRPLGMSLDRIKNNEGYRPDNCKWSTPVEQNSNKRKPSFYS